MLLSVSLITTHALPTFSYKRKREGFKLDLLSMCCGKQDK
ncbi:hypothetical protein BRCON_2484 [Candidatus Sumerlaea chitinivorans]|uniref:Uncharacterized protein n=1 Tax=Sumerlaea chitinivorans TaxID=2250252 RepID=A0A2Z4Y7N9_SUMC1|nr:hypothetical protein BRCON_2484 [Candidatus Sumerlaea chitinivorans]